MRGPRRIDSHPLTRIERGEAITFHHEGRPVRAFRGETVAAALYSEGRTVLSRSMRYHRARGLHCGTGGCTHCFLRVDGVPNVRSCLTPCEPTTWSEGQNAFPSVQNDLLGAADIAIPDYLDAHRSFARPRWLRRLYLPFVRQMAGFGRVPKAPIQQTYLRESLAPDVLVVGSGPAGLAAAQGAAEAGANVMLTEAEPHVGGRLRHLPTPFHAVQHEHAPRTEGKRYADESAADARRRGVDVRTGTRVFGVYGEEWRAVSRNTLLELRPRAVVVATGALDQSAIFPGGDRAGVMLSTAALRLVNLHGILPAEPVLIYGASREGLMLARDLVACGGRVAGIFDPREAAPVPKALVEDARRIGLPTQVGHRIVFVAGRKSPRAAILEGPTGRIRVACRTIVVALGRQLLGEVFQQAGADLTYQPSRGGWVPVVGPSLETTRKGLFAAGSAAGVEDEWSSVLRGRIAGAAAAARLEPENAGRRRLLEGALDAYAETPSAAVAPA